MGGIMKGHIHAAYSNNSSSSSRRRWINAYVVMVILGLVFGCGILGLMGLHRLKEKRVFNLLIKEKNDQILSLHLLLQKEKEHTQEVKRKTEEMKRKIFSLRAQKTELNNRVLDMQSTISSLREEQRTIGVAYQEKENEAKLLKHRYMEAKDQNPQVKSLTEILRHKEAEIEDLKHRLNEHSIIPADVTSKANMSASETMIDKNRDGDMESTGNDTLRDRETESSMQSEEHRENGRLITGGNETTGKEEIDKLENPQGITNAEDTEAHFTDSKEHATTGDARDNQELGVHKGLVKMEMQENSHGGHYRFRGKHGYLKRAKGKRWSHIAKLTEGKRDSQSNGALTTGDQGLVGGMEEIGNKLEEGKLRNQDNTTRMKNESSLNSQQFEIDDKLADAEHSGAMSNVKVYTEDNNGDKSEESPPGSIKSGNSIKPEDTEDMSHNVVKFNVSNQFEKWLEERHVNSSSEKSHISLDEEPEHSAVKGEETGLSNKGAVQHTQEDEQSKEHKIAITDHTEDKNDHQYHDHPRNEVAETNEDQHGIQMEDFEESEVVGDSEDKDEPEF